MPWDAGVGEPDDDFDPFAEHAESDWIGGEPGVDANGTGGQEASPTVLAVGGAAGSSP